MNRRSLLLAVSLVILLVPVARAESCGCTAADGSCSARASCQGRCVSGCPSNGCYAYCSGFAEEMWIESAPDPGRSRMPRTYDLVIRNGSTEELMQTLTRLTDRNVLFAPLSASATYTFDLHEPTLLDLLEKIAAYGRIELDGSDLSVWRSVRNAFLSGQSMPFCMHRTSVNALVYELSYLSGLRLFVASGDGRAELNACYESTTLDGILADVLASTGVEIRVAPAADPQGRAVRSR